MTRAEALEALLALPPVALAEQVLSDDDAAALLGVGVDRIDRLVDSGALLAAGHRSQRRLPAASVLAVAARL